MTPSLVFVEILYNVEFIIKPFDLISQRNNPRLL